MKIGLMTAFLGLALVSGAKSLARDSCLTVLVYVALADNDHQDIIPVPAKLGDGTDPDNNLYWGAAYGVKTYFSRDPDWRLVTISRDVRSDTVLERCVFRHSRLPLYVIARAYKGERIKEAVSDFLTCLSGRSCRDSLLTGDSTVANIVICGSPDLVAYVGHDGLMDFNLPVDSLSGDSTGRQAVILACMSKEYFSEHLVALRADPVLWTTGLMAPEAYTLDAAIESWAEGRSRDKIRANAAEAYDRFQHCGVKAAKRLLVTGF